MWFTIAQVLTIGKVVMLALIGALDSAQGTGFPAVMKILYAVACIPMLYALLRCDRIFKWRQ